MWERDEKGREKTIEARKTVSDVRLLDVRRSEVQKGERRVSQMPNPIHHQLLHRLHAHLKLLLRSLALILAPI